MMTEQKPQVACRCCGRTMDAQYQEAIVPGKAGYFLLTCWRKNCRMHGFTFSSKSYDAVDLRIYDKGK